MTSVTIVQETLPVDDELDRRAEKKLSEHLASQPSRKLARKS
jgi:hypothetical protein